MIASPLFSMFAIVFYLFISPKASQGTAARKRRGDEATWSFARLGMASWLGVPPVGSDVEVTYPLSDHFRGRWFPAKIAAHDTGSRGKQQFCVTHDGISGLPKDLTMYSTYTLYAKDFGTLCRIPDEGASPGDNASTSAASTVGKGKSKATAEAPEAPPKKASKQPMKPEDPPKESTRKALVVGVSYTGKNKLKNPENDAADVAQKLRDEMGFSVVHMTGKMKLRDLKTTVLRFHDSIKPGDVALFYFAGHGCEYKSRNWLLVSDVPKDDRLLDSEALNANSVLSGMQSARARFQVMILDCCRSINDMSRSARSAHAGLIEMQPARGSLVAFACAPNQTALDGAGRNGTYTKHLLQHISTPGLDLNSLFVRVANGVENEQMASRIHGSSPLFALSTLLFSEQCIYEQR